ncbi:uncharacterized protein LOC116292763 [Actinia tenebrosa]|uniref:Uncharacterized protein LOC116292763 n=1 Tax=Actinia tenebrosa TaxID=6105 RepID=A0A6P8HTG2_ACTTE|nr:uncharacterized protein LOC116292763 [Actinia tenebrosa]
MAKTLILAVILVTFLTEYSLCRKETQYRRGPDKRQYIARNSASAPYNVPLTGVKNQMWRSHSINNSSIMMENQGKAEERKSDTLEGKMKESSSLVVQNDKSLKAAEARLPPEKRINNLLGKVIQKPLAIPDAKPVDRDDVIASKRNPAAVAGLLTKIAGNEQVQQAVIDKGIEVAGKLVDKQLQIIEEAQQKASDFLKKGIKLDVTPEKAWATEDMFIPPGYHIQAEVEGQGKPDESNDPQPYTYPAGMGNMIMNGCWGTGYKKGDPCFDALEASEQCRDMIDGAAFIGVGFDGRGQYSPESRKMSIIQRSCAGKASYDNLQVPDTMNVHGIYDTTASMTVFTSRSEYQKYLQLEAGVSGSVFGFYAGVKSAWGSSESGAKQTNLAIFDIDVDRYEIFQDEVKPKDLSRNFLREFVDLPTSYFAPGAPAKFQNFILRWGTHYIKSARFGGQLELRKTQLASKTASKEEFAAESEVEFKSLFWSAGAKSSTKSGSSSQSQQSYMSTSVVVQGGSQKIAAVISDMYSPTFKTQFTEWLESIPTYPKAFKFLMGSITDLLDFRASDLFPDEKVNWGCEVHQDSLKQDKETQKFYYMADNKRVYCEFGSRDDLKSKLKLKRMSLKRAIEVYLEEGAMSISDVSLPAGEPGCESQESPTNVKKPSWSEMTTGTSPATFRVTFDLLEDLKGAPNGGIDIQKSMSRLVRYRENKWVTANERGQFHWYGGFSNGGSADLGNEKISIFGLVLKYDESDGSLVLYKADYSDSKNYFPALSELLVNKKLAQVEWTEKKLLSGNANKKSKTQVGSSLPPSLCNVQWSNGLRFDPGDKDGKCLHFTASTKGTLYVVFSAVPSDKDTWYYVELSPYRVGIYKGNTLKVSTVNKNAVALGDPILFQSYFVCITETTTSRGTLIEYGKSMGTTETGNVYLSMNEYHDVLHVRFYSFGNNKEPAQVVDSHVFSRAKTKTTCKGDTQADGDNCVQKCHETCDPIAGCKYSSQGEPKATECNECRYAKSEDGTRCLKECPTGEKPDKKKQCKKWYNHERNPQ